MPKNVLVVDDSAMMRKIVIKNLKDCGFDVVVTEANDGVEGLEKFKAGAFDCVLSDWNMPNMDGLTMVKEIRKLDPTKKVAVIMITTEGNQNKVMEAVSLGASGYVRKPFTTEQIKEKLTGLV